MNFHKNNLNVIADNLKKLRKSKNISLSTLSNKLMLMEVDISKQSLYKIE